MTRTRRSTRRSAGRYPAISLSAGFLIALIALVTLAGGASRADVLGQVVVRAGTAILLALWVIAVPRPVGTARVPLTIVAAAIVLAALQLVPLPPAVWGALPGRELYRDAAMLAGGGQPWRPLAIVPSAALNALFSLLVPLAAVLFAGAARPDDRRLVLTALIVAILVSGLLELAQFAGSDQVSPFVNVRLNQPSGLLANRNHQALLLAIGCIALPAWAVLPGPGAAWRPWAALGAVLLLILMIVATGSRAGLLLGLIAMFAIPFVVRSSLRGWRGEGSRRALGRKGLALAGAALAAILVVVVAAIRAGRSESFDRLRDADIGNDMRTRGLSTVLGLVREHWIAGSGFGSFDALFRAAEPFALLKPTYFNHAHNDFLELAMTGGLPALLLLVAALAWGVRRGLVHWRSGDPVGRLGAATVLLVLLASVFDYPARTPVVMAILAIAATWLAQAPAARDRGRL